MDAERVYGSGCQRNPAGSEEAQTFFERPGELEPDTVYWSSDMLVALRARYR